MEAVLSLHFVCIVFSDGSVDWVSMSWSGLLSRSTGCCHTAAYLRRSGFFWWRDNWFLTETGIKRSSAKLGRSKGGTESMSWVRGPLTHAQVSGSVLPRPKRVDATQRKAEYLRLGLWSDSGGGSGDRLHRVVGC